NRRAPPQHSEPAPSAHLCCLSTCGRWARSSSVRGLLGFAPHLLAVAFAGERLLGATLVARLQVERVLLDVLDDVFLLHFPLEASESAFDGFALLDLNFSHW